MSRQLDLFSEVLHAYSSNSEGVLSNAELYRIIGEKRGMPPEQLAERVPVGQSGQLHNLFTREARWHQQTLRHAGILEHVEGERGIWRLTTPASKELNQMSSGVAVVGFSTNLGIAILGSCETVFSRIDVPIVLAITSPPYPIAKGRAYGRIDASQYVDWICTTLQPVVKNLVKGGSICINVGSDVFEQGLASRSLYQERMVIALCDRLGLHKMDQLIWHNPSKPPGPIAWASKQRVQLNAGYESVYWFTNSPKDVRSDNRRVLQEHNERHLKLINQGGEKRLSHASDGAHNLRYGSFGAVTAGKIPRNVLTLGHACADQQEYKRQARAMNLAVHGAPMPLSLPKFLIEFMSKPGELVVDMFSGSFTTARAAELLGRRWLANEIMLEYVVGGANRFKEADGFEQRLFA